MDQTQRLSKLVFRSSNLRDYITQVQGEDSGELAQALQPFDRTEDYSSVQDEDILRLRKAFQDSYDRLCRRIDTYTIREVLIGKSPVERGTPVLISMLLCLSGLFLVASIFNFTYWSNRATVAVAEAQEFLAFDHSTEIARLVEMKILFDTVVTDVGSDNLEPQLMYLEGISAMQQHYSRETELVSRMHELWEEARVYRAPGEFVTKWACTRSEETGAFNVALGFAFSYLLSCQSETTAPTVTPKADGKKGAPVEANQPDTNDVEQTDAVERTAQTETQQPSANDAEQTWTVSGTDEMLDSDKTIGSADSDPNPDNALTTVSFDQRFMDIQNAQFETMKAANRRAINFYQETLDAVSLRIKDLREGLSTMHLWLLPIFYGMLGSVVYCMWRVLNPSVAALGFFYSFMRTIFAGLAAMTLSMLLVPSNILTAGVELNRPLIYLLSFIFGYSVEVFINTLNMFNTYFLANLTTRESKDAKQS